MIAVKQLSDVKFESLVKTINEAFQDYPVPMEFTSDTLKTKLEGVNTNLDYSFGVYDEEELVGFVIHALNGAVAYNVITGIVPRYRKQGLYTMMFEAALSYFNMFGIDTYQLEVLNDNDNAIKTYKKNGFEVTATYNCYKGSVKTKPTTPYEVNLDFGSDVSSLRHLENHHPSFANYIGTPQNQNIYTIQENAEIVAFIAVLNNGSVRHFGYTHPDQLQALLFNASNMYETLTINNIETYAEDVIELLETLGFRAYTYQYQMELTI
ncbi:GNAT family N-acetyltransferase [Erysipelothrix aquatica]|uniref:GNAT family N-acetyltransferase n=1 Tax=Erysipelothrix aquatica TaxID=2683714 RepID=UPI001358A990|nr:GNAT family N-acetyltransferase [Erysipelothrix aquatica]